MRIITQRLIIVLFSLVIVAVFFGSLGHCQEKMYRPAWKTDKYKSQKECMDSFGAKEAAEALKDEYFVAASKIAMGCLTNYFTCRAIVKNDNNECFNPPDGKNDIVCIGEFNSFKFYTQLFSSKEVSLEVLSYCPFKSTAESFCEPFAKGLLRGSDSHCRENDYECKAFMKLDINLAAPPKVKDQIYFVKAIKENEIKNCSQIKDKIRQRNCRAYLNKNAKICDEDEQFKKVKILYCQYYSKQ